MTANQFIALDAAALAELARLNATTPDNNRITAVRQRDGWHVIAADLLQDCGKGQTFEHYGDFLQSLVAEPQTAEEPKKRSRNKNRKE